MKLLVTVSASGLAYATAPEFEFEGPLGTSVVLLGAGVGVWIDPLEPSRFIRIQAQALEPEAQAVLELLVGADAAALLDEAANAAVEGAEFAASEVEADLNDEIWSDVSRLGFLLWLEQYSLLPLDQSDLDIEIGVIAARLGPLGIWDLASDRLQGSLARLVTLGRVADNADSGISAASFETVRTALAEVIGNQAVELDAVGADEVQQLAARLTAAAGAREHEDAQLTEELRELLLASVPGLTSVISGQRVAVDAGGAGTDAPARADSVNWNRVPRDILETEENTVVSVWVDGDLPRLEVSVEPASSAILAGRVSRSLMFEVVDDRTGDELVAAALDYDEEANRYVGSCYLERPLAREERVDVYAVGSPLQPAFGVLNRELAAQRSAVRAFQAERMPFSDEDLLENSGELWQAAADGFGTSSEFLGSSKADADRFRQRVCEERSTALGGATAAGILGAESSLAEERFFAALPAN